MEDSRFDALAKSLSAVGPRRRLLAGLVAAALAAPLGRAAARDCKRDGKPCKKNSQCCSGNCVGASGGTANDGTCQPPYFQGTCEVGDDFCVENQIDETCNPDPLGPHCACVTTAPGGETACVDVNSAMCDVLDCERDTDCTSLGEGYVCIAARGSCGCIGAGNRNFCARQCNAQPVSAARTSRTGRNPLRPGR